MTTTPTARPERLYLMELVRATVALPGWGAFPLIIPCYLVQTTDRQNILIDSGLAPGGTSTFLPPPEYERDVIAQLADLGLRPEDITTVIATHLDPDHAGHHDAFPQAEFVIQRAELEAARAGGERYDGPHRPHWDAPGLRYRDRGRRHQTAPRPYPDRDGRPHRRASVRVCTPEAHRPRAACHRRCRRVATIRSRPHTGAVRRGRRGCTYQHAQTAGDCRARTRCHYGIRSR